MKTAMQELLEKLKYTKLNSCKHLHEFVFFDGVLAIIEGGGFLEKEKQQIIDAYHINPEKSIYLNKGIDYYEETFNKTL